MSVGDVDYDFFDSDGDRDRDQAPHARRHQEEGQVKDRPPSGLGHRSSTSRSKQTEKNKRKTGESSKMRNSDSYSSESSYTSSDSDSWSSRASDQGPQKSNKSKEKFRGRSKEPSYDYSSDSSGGDDDLRSSQNDRGSRPVSRIEIRKKAKSSSSSFGASSGSESSDGASAPSRKLRHDEGCTRPTTSNAWRENKQLPTSEAAGVKAKPGSFEQRRDLSGASDSDHESTYRFKHHKVSHKEKDRLSDSGSDITHISPIDSREATPRSSRSRLGNGEVYPQGARYLHDAIDQDKMNIKMLLKAILDIDETGKVNSLEQQGRRPHRRAEYKGAFHSHAPQHQQAREIETENQRLLRGILEQSKSRTKHLRVREPAPPQRMTTSAINRLREQKKIDRENLALLKRIQGVRATKTLSKQYQLADYDRRMGSTGAQGAGPVPAGRAVRGAGSSSPYGLKKTDPAISMGSVQSLGAASSSFQPRLSKRERPMSALSQRSQASSVSTRSATAAAAAALLGSSGAKRRPAWESGW